MSDSDVPEDDRARAGEYVLGLMAPDEAALFADRLSRDAALSALVLRWQEDFAVLADEIDEVAPPARVRRRIEARLFDDTRTPWWIAPGVMGLLAATLALVLVLSPITTGVRPPDEPLYHADLAGDSGTLILAAGYDGETGELYVEPYRAPDAGTAHELWLIAGDDAPVSLGLLPAEEPARLAIAAPLAEALEGGVLAISVEPPTGSPTGAPTGPVIATGEVTTL